MPSCCDQELSHKEGGVGAGDGGGDGGGGNAKPADFSHTQPIGAEHGPSYHVCVFMKPSNAQFSSPPLPSQSFGSPGCQLRYADEHVPPYHVSQCAHVDAWLREHAAGS